MQITNNWVKKGVIFAPHNVNEWIKSHAYIPTPILLSDDIIRIFVAFRDSSGLGRIGYVDVEALNPSHILSISKSPSLDVGKPGAFDDNGVSPISIINENGRLYLYYAGWQLSDKVRYLLFGGLAISNDMGQTFARVQNVPILERTDQEFLVRTAPCVFKENNKWHMLYSGGSKLVQIHDKWLPSYSLKYLISSNGITWPGIPQEVMLPEPEVEFGLGRPFFIKEDSIYKMWYSIRRFDRTYVIGYAESLDLQHWVRMDHQICSFTQDLSPYETEMQAFASIIKTKYGNYMFYNGNNFGETGVCYAVQK